MVRRWRSGLVAVAVTAATVGLVLVDVLCDGVRAWWVDHAFTAAIVSGLLVLLVTVLVVDQVVDLRNARDRSRALAAQAAIVLSQARRSTSSATAALDGTGSREDASADVRNYMIMLLVSGPVLIDSRRARAFLEQAQRLGAQLTHVLAEPTAASVRERLAATAEDLETLAAPILDVLHPSEEAAVTGAEADA